jgi:hypothetical protein
MAREAACGVVADKLLTVGAPNLIQTRCEPSNARPGGVHRCDPKAYLPNPHLPCLPPSSESGAVGIEVRMTRAHNSTAVEAVGQHTLKG